MSRICVLNEGTIISENNKPYIIAEVNSSHNGDVDLAKRMIEEIAKAGCDCVKFQSWSTESLYSKTYYESNPISKRFVKKFSLSLESQKELAEYSRSCGIEFASTPYSKDEVDFLVDECGVPFLKVSSMELNNELFLRYIAKKNCPIILSTGMGEMEEIRNAVRVIKEEGNENLVLLHCISIYPAAPETIHLNNIIGLMEEFPDVPVGFSDHSLGTDLSVGAVAMGARVIEKHFTLDKTKIGMDNNMAIEPDEMKRLVMGCQLVYSALGNKSRIVSDAEFEQRKNMRRSIVLCRDMLPGEVICASDIDAKRPGTGISPTEIPNIIGRRIITNVYQDELLKLNDFE